jgi:hypothetical protein
MSVVDPKRTSRRRRGLSAFEGGHCPLITGKMSDAGDVEIRWNVTDGQGKNMNDLELVK